MPCSIILMLILISNTFSLKTLFEDNFNELNETKWEIISFENQCMSELPC